MLELSFLTNNNIDKQIFYYTGNWQTWQKPEGRTMAYILVIGAGAGGGGGQGSGATRGGGGGGASGNIFTTIIPFLLLPDTLYIFVGKGGDGGADNGTTSATAGGSGGLSYVSVTPSTDNDNIICVTGSAVPTGGNGGTISSAGAGGTAGAAPFANTFRYLQLGINSISSGVNGTVGGYGLTNATSSTIASSAIIGGGTGGGGSNNAGGSSSGGTVLAQENLPAFFKNVTNGSFGYRSLKPFLFASPAGGNGGGINPGQNGGNGQFGCGGGGGGAGTHSVGQGAGGRGGDGLVMIISY